jgi:hypothetical protein
MGFRLENQRTRRLGPALGIAGVLLFLPALPSAMESPFDQARTVVQEMMQQAATADAVARTPEAKGRAQEEMGFAIVNLALINQGEPKQMVGSISPKAFSPHASEVQEMLGKAIMEAAWAETYPERARAQEMLGMLIMNSALIDLGEIQVGLGGEDETVTSRP